jgi:hypothetical protein
MPASAGDQGDPAADPFPRCRNPGTPMWAAAASIRNRLRNSALANVVSMNCTGGMPSGVATAWRLVPVGVLTVGRGRPMRAATERLDPGEVPRWGLAGPTRSPISARRGAQVVKHGGHSAVCVRLFVVAELGED